MANRRVICRRSPSPDRRLVGSVRERDTVARLSGDEFVVMRDDLALLRGGEGAGCYRGGERHCLAQ